MPRSGKGHANKRAAKMVERVRVRITPELAALLEREAKGRAGDAPLLTRSNGEPWGYRRSDQYRLDFAEVVTAAGLDPKTVALSALRHSYICVHCCGASRSRSSRTQPTQARKESGGITPS